MSAAQRPIGNWQEATQRHFPNGGPLVSLRTWIDPRCRSIIDTDDYRLAARFSPCAEEANCDSASYGSACALRPYFLLRDLHRSYRELWLR